MNTLQFLFFLIISTASLAIHAQVAKLESRDLTGLIPASWLDNTGFEFADIPEFNVPVPEEDMIPLLPLFQSGGFGKKVYIGVVIDEKYLQHKTLSQLQKIKSKIAQMKTPDGNGLHVHTYKGKLYGIRSDYDVIYSSSTTIGLSLSFNPGKIVNIGEVKTYGMSLAFNAPINLEMEKGFNAASMLQKTIDDWAIGLKEDESQLIVDQAISITPVLMSYYLKKNPPLLDETQRPLVMLQGTKLLAEPHKPARYESVTGSFSKEWNQIRKDLGKNLSQEAKWRADLAPHRKAEKVYADKESQILIQNICDELAATYQVPEVIWPRCQISATLVPNAWAYPGGDIFISAGLIGLLPDIDSVALVLAHEIGHVIGRHGSRELKTKKAFAYAATFVSTAANMGLAALSLTGGGSLLGPVSFLTWYPQTFATMALGNYVLERGTELASLAPLAGLSLKSRDLEREADRLGQEAAFATGADLERMKEGWKEFSQFIRQLQSTDNDDFRRVLFRNHPSNEERAKVFEAQRDFLEKNLGETRQHRNALLPMALDYKNLHKDLRPYVKAYARLVKKRLQETQTKFSEVDVHKSRHLVNSLLGHQGLCVQHALGAQTFPIAEE